MATEGPCPSSEETKCVRTSGGEWEAKQPIVRPWFRHYSLSSGGIGMDHSPGTITALLIMQPAELTLSVTTWVAQPAPDHPSSPWIPSNPSESIP